MSETFRVIDYEAHGIPKLRHKLPFVNQAGLFTFQKRLYTNISNS